MNDSPLQVFFEEIIQVEATLIYHLLNYKISRALGEWGFFSINDKLLNFESVGHSCIVDSSLMSPSSFCIYSFCVTLYYGAHSREG